MTDHYTVFSFTVDIQKAEHAEWLQEALSTDLSELFPIDKKTGEHDQEALRKWCEDRGYDCGLETPEDIFWPEFEWGLKEGEIGGPRAVLTIEASEGTSAHEQAAHFVHLFLKQFQLDDGVGFFGSFLTSRGGSEGGFGYFLTKDRVSFRDVGHWVEEQAQEHWQHNCIEPHLSHFSWGSSREGVQEVLDEAIELTWNKGAECQESLENALKTINNLGSQGRILLRPDPRGPGNRTTDFYWVAQRKKGNEDWTSFYEGGLNYFEPNEAGGFGRPVQVEVNEFPRWTVNT